METVESRQSAARDLSVSSGAGSGSTRPVDCRLSTVDFHEAAMNQRVERVAGEIREVLAGALGRGEIKDPRVQQAGLVTVTHVRLTGDLRDAQALFIVHDADAEALERVRQGLTSAAGYLRRLIGRQLRLKVVA